MKRNPVISPALVAVLFAVCGATSDAGDWSRWTKNAAQGVGVSATFSPYSDTRDQLFSKGSPKGYASCYRVCAYPGEVVIDCDAGKADAAGLDWGPWCVKVDAVPVKPDKSGAPAISEDVLHAKNPFLPYGIPSGQMGRPDFTSVTRFPQGAPLPLHAPFHIPCKYRRYIDGHDAVFRVCWSLYRSSPRGDRLVARGVLPDAFTFKDNDEAHRVKDRPATVGLAFETLAPPPPALPDFCFEDHWHGRAGDYARHFGIERTWPPSKTGAVDYIIPGETLGRPVGGYYASTIAFQILFMLVSGAMLLYYFAFRKGEARLAVWWALPICAVGASAVALFVLPLFLDRSSRVDVTRWRYAVNGEGDDLWIDVVRAAGFDPLPISWEIPADGWFLADNLETKGRVVYDLASNGGTMRLYGPRGDAGGTQRAMGISPAPAEGQRFTLSPDTGAAAANFEWVLSDGGNAPDEAARGAFHAVMRDWSNAYYSDPGRTITAHGDYACVWVHARGSWFALGPMASGETRNLSESRCVEEWGNWERPNAEGLLSTAPFALTTGKVTETAMRWLGAQSAKNTGEEAAAPAIDRAFLERLDDAVVVGLRAGNDAHSSMEVRWSARHPRPQLRAERIVDVEVVR